MKTTLKMHYMESSIKFQKLDETKKKNDRLELKKFDQIY